MADSAPPGRAPAKTVKVVPVPTVLAEWAKESVRLV